ncbi:MAG: O-antigen ligase family protein [Rhizobiaceae bacterium]|nr:O-antigen ligase family protein [Rhizobiaceae bacterium]MCV0408158.1 O-antigen ligase family protein [Rhizobiaceae bacterium]
MNFHRGSAPLHSISDAGSPGTGGEGPETGDAGRAAERDATLRGAVSRWWAEPWTLPRLNRDFTFMCYATPPALGSTASFIFHGGGLFCLFSVLTGRRQFAREPHVLWLTAACWAVVLAYLVSAVVNGLPEGGAWKMVWLWTFFIFPFSYSIWRVADKAALVRACIMGAALASYSAFAVALVQFAVMDLRPEGGAGNAIVFATVASLTGLVSLAGALHGEGRGSVLCLGAAVAAVIAVLLSGTRGALPGLVLGGVLLLFLYRHRFNANFRRSGALAAGGAVLVALVFAVAMAPRFAEALTDLQGIGHEDYETSLGLRFIMLIEGAKVALENPVFGWGPASSAMLMERHVQGLVDMAVSYTHFHNAFLTILVEAGIPGLAALVALVVVPLVVAFRALRAAPAPEERFGAVLMMLAVVVATLGGLSSIMIGHDILDTVFVMSLALGAYLAAGRPGITPPIRETDA